MFPTMADHNRHESHNVNFAKPRPFGQKLRDDLTETFYPDDPFKVIKSEAPNRRFLKTLEYFVPIFEWLPNYNIKLFWYDLLAGITIVSLAIPQGISYANLANIPPLVGLYSSFVPPLIYAIFGTSKTLGVGPVAACSLFLFQTIGAKVDPTQYPTLYLHLIFTSTFLTGVFETALGIFRLGIVVDFISHSTLTGFMGGTAVIIILQQLKGFLGLKHFTTNTDVVSVLKAVFTHKNEWRWESALMGIIFLFFLQLARFVRNKKPKLFWVSAIAPLITVIIGGLFAFFANGEKYGIAVVGPLKRGINPISIKQLNFDRQYMGVVLLSGVVTAILSLAEGIAIGRSYAILKNEQVDGNKEILAFGLMNIIGSFFSCYLTTGPFSKSAVNHNAGCKSQMSNAVMSICMLLILLFLAPLFSYTPLVVLSAIIMSAMFGLIDYEKAVHLYKVDKFDFIIGMVAFLGVAFGSMDLGLGLSFLLGIIRALLYTARPATCKMGNMPNSKLYRDIKQYPIASEAPGILVLQLGSPILFSNSTYIRERVLRWIRDEESTYKGKDSNQIEHLILDVGGVTAIDMNGIETLFELKRLMSSKDIQISLVNPRMEVLEKLTLGDFIDVIGKESVHLTINDAVNFCRYKLSDPRLSSPTQESV